MRKPVAVGMAVGRSSRMDAKVAAVKKEVKVGGDFETRGLFCAEEIAELRHRLLAWYDVNHRILPWRKNPHSKRSDRDAGPPLQRTRATLPTAFGCLKVPCITSYDSL